MSLDEQPPGGQKAPETIPEALQRAARVFERDEAVVDDGRRVSYGELAGLVHRTARALVASGIEPQDRVAIWAPNSLEWILASFAVYSTGGVLVPINTRFKGEEAGHVLRTSRARLLLTTSDSVGGDLVSLLDDVADLDALEEVVVLSGRVAAGRTGWDELLARADAVPASSVELRESQVEGEGPSDIIFTSGTTGKPKGAVLTHQASVRTYLQWSELVGLRRGDRYLIVYPFFHTAGLKSGILACVLRGSTMIPHAVFDVDTMMTKVAQERVSMLPGPPTVFQSILDHPSLPTFDLSSLRLSVTGAATVPEEVIRRMRDELRFETVVTGYGLTETTGTVSMCRHDDPPEVVARTVGKPLSGVELCIADDDGRPVATGQQGEVLVRGFNLMKGYFDDPAATAAAVDDDGWLHTGDIGFVDDAGNLHITDRKKDMYIVGGFNAYPAEIERIILRHPGVAQVAVVGIPDRRLGEVGVAFVVARSGRPTDGDELLGWCRAHMANYKVPRAVRFVDALPLNPSGKVMKYVLRAEATT